MNKRVTLFSVGLILVMALVTLSAGQVNKVNAQAATGTLTASPTVIIPSTATLVPVLPVTGGQAAQNAQQELLASNIIGRMAYLQDGVQLGPISSIIVDSQSGQIQYAVILLSNQTRTRMNSLFGVNPGVQLGLQNAQGQGGQYVPVPWQMINVLPQIEAQQLSNNAPLNNPNNVVPTMQGSTPLPTSAATLAPLPTMAATNNNPLIIGTPNAPAFVTPNATQSDMLLLTPGATQTGVMQLAPDVVDDTDNDNELKEQEAQESNLSQQAQNTPQAFMNITATPLVGQQSPSTGSYYLQQFNSISVQASLENLNGAPSFNSNEVRNWQGQNWGQTIASYWNNQVAALPQTGAQLSTDHLIEFQNLQGITVMNASNTVLGYVEDMVIDQASGQVTYTLVRANNGQLNANAHLVAVPFSALQWMQNDYLPEFQIPQNSPALENAPIVNSNSQINSLSGNSSYQQQVNSYWNVQGTEGGAAVGATPGVSAATSTPLVGPVQTDVFGTETFNFGTTTPTP